MKKCSNCGELTQTEEHHIVSRKQQPALKKCNMDLIDLCAECHRGTRGTHGKYGATPRKLLKLEFQKKLYEIFEDEYISIEEIEKKLKISYKDTIKITKLLYPKAGLYLREDVIRACMGGKLVTE